MKPYYRYFFAVIISIISLPVLSGSNIPSGWIQAGSNKTDYNLGIDRNNGTSGGKSAFIESKVDSPEGFSTMMQNASVADYKGKRIKMSTYVSTENVKNWSGVWLRIDKGSDSVAFDNMGNRGISGTNDWKQYSIVLDVPESATSMSFSGLIFGEGKIWFDKFDFEVVDKSVPVTDLMKRVETKQLKCCSDRSSSKIM
ncbi:hypothetical protein [Aliikangiella sp. IMCC44359]|uniref:hypothetical protein n=1 Tax=Aliikangiella sp. IMCC44359 TaxID=3459125 RepID=UPI00403ABB5C